MHDWLTHRARATPDAEALVAAEGGTTWTYRALHEAADEVASRLAGVGIEPGDHVAACLSPRPEYVTLVHAVMRLGARLVPLGHELTAAELRPRVEQSDANLLVVASETEQAAVEATTEGGPPVVSLDEPGWETVRRLQAVSSAPVEPASWSRADRLVSLFTSGSTGTPKLVELTVGNVFASVVALAFRLGVHPDDRTLATLAFHHTGGLLPLYRATLAGTTIILRRSFEPGATADDIRRHDVSKVSLVPVMLKRMLDARGTLADSLRAVLLGGAPAPESLIERCRDYSIPVYPTYGMTEASSGITVATPDEAFDRPGTVGRPLLGTELSVRDEAGQELTEGEIGELVVSGPTITPGYYHAAETTAAAFSEHGLRTGDVGYVEDGLAYVLNRKDDRIITGGENVDPGEVVGVMRGHPHVADAAVVGIDDPEWGQRVAALVVRSDETLSPEDLRAFCRDRLADFKLPRTIRFTDELPRTDSGTVERPAVREQLAIEVEEAEPWAAESAPGRSDDSGESTDGGADSAVESPDVTSEPDDPTDGSEDGGSGRSETVDDSIDTTDDTAGTGDDTTDDTAGPIDDTAGTGDDTTDDTAGTGDDTADGTAGPIDDTAGTGDEPAG